MASNVPKFASFRPKPKAAPISPAETELRDRPSSKTKKSKADRAPSPRTSKIPESKADVGASKSYFSDRRGDQDVLRYGTLNRSDIPSFRRIGYGYVLGLDLDQKIDRERSSHGKIYLTPATRQRQERLLTAKHAPKDGTRMLRVVKLKSQDDINEDDDYISISSARKRKRDSSENQERQTPELGYRGMERNDVQEPLDRDIQYDSDIENSSTVAESTKKNSQLVRHTRESPQDLQAWLNFIEHQEAMLAVDRSELNENLRQRLADVRISIYEEALKKTLPENHIRLYQGLLQEAKRSWNGVKLAGKFEEILAKYPANGDLWLMYLEFVQSRFTVFKYESCRGIFSRCLKAFRVASKDADILTILHIVIRLTALIQGAGYQELALAIWQAILEFHVMIPPVEAPNDRPSLSDFEQFWDAETQRIGESGVNGWRKPALEDHVPGTAALQSRDASMSAFEDFQMRETEATHKLRYPGRTADEVGEDDAFHTVFFTDIEEYLNVIPENTPSTLLVEAFLCFCGLPPLPRIAKHQGTWWNDPFLSHIFDQVSASRTTSSQADLLVDRIECYSVCITESMQMTIDTLFKQSFSLEGMRLGPDFVRRVLKLVTAEHTNEEIFGEYLLAFESRHYPSDVVKTAKQLLKVKPTSQRLYHAYGLAELNRTKLQKADQVFSMALSMGGVGSFESISLLHSSIWTALHNGDEVQALWRLVSYTGKTPTKEEGATRPDGDKLQSTQGAIGSVCEKALLRQDHTTAVLGTSLLALLTYLSTTKDTEAALTAHRGLSQWFTSHSLSTSPYAELNAQAMAQFLTYHASTAAIVKPAIIRSALEPLLALFPNNTILLSLYAANEARFAIYDRVRGIMQQNALQSSGATSVAGWSFAIRYETLRGDVAGSTSHSLRALYQRATCQDASGAHSPALWASYLRFEIAQLQLEQVRTKDKKLGKDGKRRTWESRLEEAKTRVKETFYAGLRSLPWCKDFIMLAFKEVKGVFSEEELWKVYRVMQEKELRVYIELD